MPEGGPLLGAYVGPELNPDQVETLAGLLRKEISGGIPIRIADAGQVILVVTPELVYRIEPDGACSDRPREDRRV